jgi:hypothetical protein
MSSQITEIGLWFSRLYLKLNYLCAGQTQKNLPARLICGTTLAAIHLPNDVYNPRGSFFWDLPRWRSEQSVKIQVHAGIFHFIKKAPKFLTNGMPHHYAGHVLQTLVTV